jgi:hypothetical protein
MPKQACVHLVAVLEALRRLVAIALHCERQQVGDRLRTASGASALGRRDCFHLVSPS